MEWLGYPSVETFRGLDISGLPLNHAWVTANTTVDSVGVYSVRGDCFNCPYKLEKHLKANTPDSWQVDSSSQMSWRIVRTSRPEQYITVNDKTGWLCEMRPTFHEYGVYQLNVGKCEVKSLVPAVHTYFPLLLSCLVLLTVCMIYSFINYMWQRKRQSKEGTHEKVLQISEENEDNYYSVYTFRGILLALIIFITTGGGGYPIFNNSWGGLNLAEGLFFVYVWSIGFHIPIAMDQAFKQHCKCTILRDIFVRAFILVILGTVIDSTIERQHATTMVLWCPLQRLGLAYLLVAAAYVLTVQKFEMKSKLMISKAITNFMSLLWCWIISGFLLAIIVIAMSIIQSLNCLSNIGLEEKSSDYSNIQTEPTLNCNNNFTEYGNNLIVGLPLKMINVNNFIGFRGGALGILSAVLYAMIGLKAGVVYLQTKMHSDRIKLWSFWATLYALGGGCSAVLSYHFNFNLWPISSILLISAASIYVFSLVHLVSEVWKSTSRILTAAGVTSLVILSGHLLFSQSLPFNFQMHFQNHLFYLMQNFWIVFVWLVNGIMLFKRDIKFEM